MSEQSKTLLFLHIIVFFWAGSGLVGDMIQLEAEGISFYRMLLASIILGTLCYAKGIMQWNLPRELFKWSILTGICLAIHWWAFFEAIKQSTVSIGLVCLSAGPFFTACLQPLLLGTRFKLAEMVLGSLCLGGILLIFGFEPNYTLGLCLGLFAALTEVVHSILTSKIVKASEPTFITFIQMAVGVITLTLLGGITHGTNLNWLTIQSFQDVLGLIFLGAFCSALAMSVYLKCLKTLSPFSAVLSVNMEPVYGIVLALVIFGEKERMSGGFYFGAIIVTACVFTDTLMKRFEGKKAIKL